MEKQQLHWWGRGARRAVTVVEASALGRNSAGRSQVWFWHRSSHREEWHPQDEPAVHVSNQILLPKCLPWSSLCWLGSNFPVYRFWLTLFSRGNRAYVNFLNAFCPASPKSESRGELLRETAFHKRAVSNTYWSCLQPGKPLFQPTSIWGTRHMLQFVSWRRRVSSSVTRAGLDHSQCLLSLPGQIKEVSWPNQKGVVLVCCWWNCLLKSLRWYLLGVRLHAPF